VSEQPAKELSDEELARIGAHYGARSDGEAHIIGCLIDGITTARRQRDEAAAKVTVLGRVLEPFSRDIQAWESMFGMAPTCTRMTITCPTDQFLNARAALADLPAAAQALLSELEALRKP